MILLRRMSKLVSPLLFLLPQVLQSVYINGEVFSLLRVILIQAILLSCDLLIPHLVYNALNFSELETLPTFTGTTYVFVHIAFVPAQFLAFTRNLH